MKTDIFNLIILDESGSMSSSRKSTISGCNETINTIQAAQQEFAETQNHYISIYAFQENPSVPSRYLLKNIPAKEVHAITRDDYNPWGCTPLYDALGATLVDLKLAVDERPLAVGAITVITDGMENASRHYSYERIIRMIDALKEVGWTFNFIGADINVAQVSGSLHMDAYLSFQKGAAGEQAMYEKENYSRRRHYSKFHDKIHAFTASGQTLTKNVLYSLNREDADKHFDDEEENSDKK